MNNNKTGALAITKCFKIAGCNLTYMWDNHPPPSFFFHVFPYVWKFLVQILRAYYTTLVAMATKFESEWTITWLVQQTWTRSLCTPGVCGFQMSDRTTFTTTDPVCDGNIIWDKIGYNSVCITKRCSKTANINEQLTSVNSCHCKDDVMISRH